MRHWARLVNPARRALFYSQENAVNYKHARLALVLALVASLGACASTRTQQAPGEVIDDSVVTTKVKTELVKDPVTKARQIDVETFRGKVQLSGFVDTAEAKARAAEIAGQVTGVTSVKNNLEVRATDTTVGTTIDDSLLTTKVKAELVSNPITKARQINVTTLRGVVQLSGFVDSATEKAEATRVASAVTGVKDVHNDLSVKTSK
jgi:hyperosmotically inducible protein